MPAFTTCLCGYSGPHGFDYLPHGIRYYHGSGQCTGFIAGPGGRKYAYPSEYKVFLLDIAECDGRFADPVWRAGMLSGWDKRGWVRAIITELGGTAQTARKLRDAWKPG